MPPHVMDPAPACLDTGLEGGEVFNLGCVDADAPRKDSPFAGHATRSPACPSGSVFQSPSFSLR